MEQIISTLIGDDCVLQRPAYSRYQIGTLIKRAKSEQKVSTKQLAEMWDMPVDMVRLIEDGKRSLNTIIYKKISKFVGIDFEDLTRVYTDDNCYSFRQDSTKQSEDVKKTVRLANLLFHEILNQQALTGKV